MSAVPNPASNGSTNAVLSDEQRMLADAVTTFVGRATNLKRVRALRDTEPGFDRNLWASIAEQGWLGIVVPEQYGGQGLGFGEMRVVVEGLGGALMPEPVTACAVLASRALLHGDNEALKKKLLPQMVAGKLVIALAWQEGNTGTDQAAKLTASKNAQGYVLNGSKRFVTPSGADGLIVSAVEGDRLGLYYVAGDANGIAKKLERYADGTFGALLTFKDVQVAAGDVAASTKVGEAALRRAIDEATIMASVELYAVTCKALTLTFDYMKTRVQFGKPIGSFQALQHRAVDLWIQKELASAIVDHAVKVADENADPARLAEVASCVKSRCSDAGADLTRDCIRLHGAIGFTDDYDAGLHLQRALVRQAWLGNGAEHRRRFDATRSTFERAEAGSAAIMAKIKPANLPGEPGERPADTDWNALSDDEFRHEAIAYYEKHYPKYQLFMMKRPRKHNIYDYMRVCFEHGWLAPAWPRKWGGMELSPSKMVILFEERERIGVSRVLEHGLNLLGPALMKFGTEEQQRQYLPKILSVEYIFCQGYSEPNAGSDLASLQTRAELDGDHYVVNGSKIWTSLAQDASHMFLLARTDPEAKRQAGISFFILDLKTPGVTIKPIVNITGEPEFCQCFFDNVRIPKENIVGGLNNGWTVAKGLLGFERLNSGSPRRPQYPMNKTREIAVARGLWEDAEFRSKYTKLELDVTDLALLYQRYSDVIASGGTPGPGMSMLKIWSSETTMRMNSLMIELAGSSGCLSSENVEFGEADEVKVNILGSFYILFPATIAAGANDIQRNILAKRALGLP